jgi:hypothetical protein
MRVFRQFLDGVLRSSRRLLSAYCTDIGPRGKNSLTAQALYKKTIDAVILSSGSNNYEICCKGQLDVSIGVIHPSYLPGP